MQLALRRIIHRTNGRKCSSLLSNKNFIFSGKYDNLSKITSHFDINNQTRTYCDGRDVMEEQKTTPTMMKFPPIMWPTIFKYARNWIFANFIIKPHFDPEFDLSDFTEATKQAVEVISQSLQDGDYTSLDGLLAKEAIDELKSNIDKMSVAQRQNLAISKDDIFYSFPYQVGVMFEDDDKRWVEITMCYHVLRGMQHMKEIRENPPITIGFNPEFQDKLFVLNYRFIREYTKGVEDSWTTNIVNHFKPKELFKKSK